MNKEHMGIHHDDDDDGQEDRQYEIIRSHVAQLSEHFDTVQIFCTRQQSNGLTRTIHNGEGNFWARYGQVEIWVRVEGERAVSEYLSPDDD